MSKDNSKWAGPDEINGVLHVGRGYRQAFFADRLRTDREQWYPGDSESGENGIWGDARPGSFDPSKVYRVPVERKGEPGMYGDSRVEALEPMQPADQMPLPCKVTPGYRFGNSADRNRIDRMEWVVARVGTNIGWWCEANPGTYHPSRLYQVPREITAASYPPSQGEGTRLEKADQQEPTMTAEHATGILGWHMRADSDFAWTWHCNIAMAAADAGAPIKEANERAADFMRSAFGVDVRDCEQWKAEQSQAVPPPVGEFEDGGREGGPDCRENESESPIAKHFRRQFGLVIDRVELCIRQLLEMLEDKRLSRVDSARIHGHLEAAESMMRILMNVKHSVPSPEDAEPGDDEPEHLTAADFLRQDSAVDHPSHYNAGPIECIDAIRAALTAEEFRGFCKGSTIKYVWRERGKGGDEDLDKGVRFLGWARNDGKGVEE